MKIRMFSLILLGLLCVLPACGDGGTANNDNRSVVCSSGDFRGIAAARDDADLTAAASACAALGDATLCGAHIFAFGAGLDKFGMFCLPDGGYEADEPDTLWPGPGYGCVQFNGRPGLVPAGWNFLGDYLESAGCLDAWDEPTLLALLDRRGNDQDACASAANLEQCLAIHDAPRHCRAILGWPFSVSDDGACVDPDIAGGDYSTTQLDRAEFLGCGTVYEDGNETIHVVRGLILEESSGRCLWLDNYLEALPGGWRLADCEECGE